MPKYVLLPPIDDDMRAWARRLREALPQLEVVVAEDDATAARELVDADAAYGGIPPDVLPTVERLRLLQNPFAGPPPGYYYPALADHPVTVSNPRGIYSDHIAHHIMMFMLALSRGLPLLERGAGAGPLGSGGAPAGLRGPGDVDRADRRGGRDRGRDGATLRGLRRAGDRRRSAARAGRAGRDRAARRTRPAAAGGGLRRDDRAAHARDRRDVGHAPLPGDEALGLLHQHRAGA